MDPAVGAGGVELAARGHPGTVVQHPDGLRRGFVGQGAVRIRVHRQGFGPVGGNLDAGVELRRVRECLLLGLPYGVRVRAGERTRLGTGGR